MIKGKWIWLHDSEKKDEYVQFYDTFVGNGKKTVIKIACDTNYILYVNGAMAGFGQYSAYPDTRVYDTIDISAYTQNGVNELAILVWYWGEPFMVYSVGKAGLMYEVTSDGETVAYSSEDTLCRLAPDYEQGHCKQVNIQQGLTFFYDPTNKDGFGEKNYTPQGFVRSVVRDIPCTLVARPNQKLDLRLTRVAKLIDEEHQIYDLGEECAGVLHIRYRARKKHRFSICFGEYVKEDGDLLRFFDAHDYTLNYVGTGAEEEHVAYMRRIGCRYLQVLGSNIEILFLGLKETPYPLQERPVKAVNERIQRIYDVSVKTLQLCMHEHYEDCPWREQVLYSMDSRNAMLCTYEVFKEYEFAKSNLWLMKNAPNIDGFYPASFPSGKGRFSIIPMFNLIQVIQAQEYLTHSGDKEGVRDIFANLENIINNFVQRIHGGLFKEIKGAWNFVEWTDNMRGHEPASGTRTPIAVNCILILALEAMTDICKRLDIEKDYSKTIANLRQNVYNGFYDSKQGAFRSYVEEDHVCSLGNALAVLAGCAGDKKHDIIEKLAKGVWNKSALAMRGFVYDALLEAGDKYKDVILQDILSDYGYMLDCGATTFWETLEGEKQYGGAGSLCHVWSALPILYFKKLGVVKEINE